MRFINLTPHTLNIHMAETGVLEIPASGTVARVETTREFAGNVAGVHTFTVTYGEITGLPALEDGVSYIVSGMVAGALRENNPGDVQDVFSPGELIRDSSGRPIGCRGLTRA